MSSKLHSFTGRFFTIYIGGGEQWLVTGRPGANWYPGVGVGSSQFGSRGRGWLRPLPDSRSYHGLGVIGDGGGGEWGEGGNITIDTILGYGMCRIHA